MLPVNFIARRREIRFPLFLLISIIRKYLYFLRNLKDCFNFDFFEYLNLKKKKKKNVIKFDIETITVRPLITPFKKKYHSRNKCSIIDSPIFSFVYSYEHLRRDQSAFDAIRGRIPFRNRLFHGASERDAVREITLTTDLASLVFRCFCERERLGTGLLPKVDRDDQRLSSKANRLSELNHRSWSTTPFRSTS